MHGSLATARSSKAKGWVLVALVIALLAVLFVAFDLGSRFQVGQAMREVAASAVHNLMQRPEPRPPYPRVSKDGQASQASKQ